MRAVEPGVYVWQPEPLRVWALSRDDLGAMVSLDDVAPILESEGSGLVTTTFDGELVVVDSRGGAPIDGTTGDADAGASASVIRSAASSSTGPTSALPHPS